MKLADIAEILSCHLEGDGELEISGIATLEEAKEGQLSFFTNAKYLSKAQATKASALIAGFDCSGISIALLKSSNPYLTFAKTLELFHSQEVFRRQIHPTAVISDKASLGKDVSIGAYAFIEDGVVLCDDVVIESHCSIHQNVRIGVATKILSGCVLRAGVQIGDHCLIQSNSVLGADGFGYAKQEDGSWYKILQTGNVIIGDDVEIGAGTTIDRATLGATTVSHGVKIDNLVQIGHGSSIGANSLLCAQVGLAGSTRVGKNVILAGQVGAAGHLNIGDHVSATGKTGIANSVSSGTVVSGSPAIEHQKWLRSSAIFARLPELLDTVRDLEMRLIKLETTFKVKLEGDELSPI